MSGSCRLCGAPLAVRAQAGGEFCCPGCARVHQVIGGMDAERAAVYVEAARRLGIVPGGPPGEPRASARDAEAVREQRLCVTGMYCPSCSWIVEQVLSSQPGVEDARVDFFSQTGLLRYDMRRTSAGRLDEILSPLGYGLGPIEEPRQDRRSVFEFVACGVLFMNLMSLSALRYFEQMGLLDGVPAFLPWVELALTIPIFAIGWTPFALRAIEGRGLTMDVLVATAALAALAISLASLLTGRREIYFETAAGLVTISMLGRTIEAWLRRRAFSDLVRIMRIHASRVRRLAPDSTESYPPVSGVGHGDTVLFLPGETVVFDGEALGEAYVSEAVLTGEPRPVRKVPGDRVVAGSLVQGGDLRLRVGRRFDETRLHEVARSVSESLARSSSRLASADRISRWFTPAVLGIAMGAWLLRLAVHGWAHACSPDGWFPSIAVLAVACPCAFGLAGVSAITAATGALLGRGILVKDSSELERLGRVRHVVFDKTGTLTEGELEVVDIVWRSDPRPELLPLVLEAEAGSSHPVAHALRVHLADRGLAAPGDAGSVEEVPGLGRVLLGERPFQVGARSLFDDAFDPPTSRTAVWFGHGRRAEGCFLLEDRVRPEAARVVERIRGLGCSVEIVSGDRPEAAERLGAELGVPATGGLTLDDKVVRMRSMGRPAVYVGDGTNDALAMGEAEASIALARSTDEALAASGFVLLSGSLSAVPDLLAVARKLSGVVASGYVWAFAFNVLFIPVAAAGRLTPLAAVLIMLASSVAVLVNALRMRRPGFP